MSIFSDFKLNKEFIALYGNESWHLPSIEAKERIEQVVEGCVAGCFTSAYWDQIVDGSVPADEVAQGLLGSRSRVSLSLHLYSHKMQISSEDERYLSVRGETGNSDLFREHIEPQLKQMLHQLDEISGSKVERIYVKVEVGSSQPSSSPSAPPSDLEPATPLRLAERAERRARRILSSQPRPVVPQQTFWEFVQGGLLEARRLFSSLRPAPETHSSSEESV